MAQNQNFPIALQPLRMDRFTERFSDSDTNTGDLYRMAEIVEGGSVEYLKPSEPVVRSVSARIAHTALLMCNADNICSTQVCAYYMSALGAVFPEMFTKIKSIFSGMGYSMCITTEITALASGLHIMDPIDTPRLWTMIGQVLLLPYRNISAATYERYMVARTNDLKAASGFQGDLSPAGNIVLSIRAAEIIKVCLGCYRELRSMVLMALLANKSTVSPMGRVCSYLCEILNWTEMGSIVSIFDTLLLTKSPVLRDLRVRAEVINVTKAYKKIMATEYPQYFKILFPIFETSVMFKNKFLVLLAVAQACRTDRHVTVDNYTTRTFAQPALVNELATLHRQYIHQSDMPRMTRFIDDSTNIDP